ncbi:MAG: DUF697 domain-containing protein [Bacteroidota bacterium]
MIKNFAKYTSIVAVLVITVFALFCVNQLINLYANLLLIHETLAISVITVISIIVFTLFAIPVILLARLPKSISSSEMDDANAYAIRLKRRLASNKHIKAAKIDLSDPVGLGKALELLRAKAEETINTTATAVFLTTAVSQNGKLDALTIFITQTRMIWKIAHLYWQRPSLRDMLRLYANVGGSALIASELEDIDITRQIEPIMSAILKSPGRSIPLVGHAAHIITDSLLEGSTNAFLTLRVGVLTLRYCGGVHPEMSKKELKRSAYSEASQMLRVLVIKSSGKVVSSVINAMKEAGMNTVNSGVETLNKAADSVKAGFNKLTRRSKKSNAGSIQGE